MYTFPYIDVWGVFSISLSYIHIHQVFQKANDSCWYHTEPQ